MNKDNLIELKNPEPFIDDPITEILRNGYLPEREIQTGIDGKWSYSVIDFCGNLIYSWILGFGGWACCGRNLL